MKRNTVLNTEATNSCTPALLNCVSLQLSPKQKFMSYFGDDFYGFYHDSTHNIMMRIPHVYMYSLQLFHTSCNYYLHSSQSVYNYTVFLEKAGGHSALVI